MSVMSYSWHILVTDSMILCEIKRDRNFFKCNGENADVFLDVVHVLQFQDYRKRW